MEPRKSTEVEKEELLNYWIECDKEKGVEITDDYMHDQRTDLAVTAIAVFDDYEGFYSYSGKVMVAIIGVVENTHVYVWEKGKLKEVDQII